jgi:ribose transport system ATP-binding protein
MIAALELTDITKSFPGVMALRGVSFRLEAGSIHALLGENGAGKSTMIKIITGVQSPSGGIMKVRGEVVSFRRPIDATAAGIGVVHQERNLIPDFSVGENILLDRIAAASVKPIHYEALYREAESYLRLLDSNLDPRTSVSRLNVATMQMVEIARALSLRSQVLLMDEPTASLTPHEVKGLFKILRNLRDQGVAIVFVSHKLDEVLDLCDTVTVLRDGANASANESLGSLNRGDLVRRMIGRAEQIHDFGVDAPKPGATALELKGLSTLSGHRNIDLHLCRGEVVGIYGLVGAGRTELARAIIGIDEITAGKIEIDGKPVRVHGVTEAVHRFGIGYVSEDRKQEGVILIHDILANAGITIWSRLRGWLGLLSDNKVTRAVKPTLSHLEVKAPSLRALVGDLSGGNQQKVSLSQWLVAGVKTKAYFHELLHRLAREGTAVLLVSSDMPELITLSDRILVMNDYRLVGELPNSRDYNQVSQSIMNFIHKTEPAQESEV